MHQLSPADAQMIFMESDPAPNQVSLILICDQATAPNGKVRFKQIMAKMEAAIEHAPNFGCRLIRVPLNIDEPYWFPDADFDIEFHVRHMALPKPGDWRQLCIQIARLISRPLDPTRPLWEMYVIEGLNNVKGVPSGCFAVVLKMHHAMIDGLGTMALLSAMLDDSPKPRKKKSVKPASAFEQLPSNLAMATKSIKRLFTRPSMIKQLIVAAPRLLKAQMDMEKSKHTGKGVPNTILNGPLTPARIFDAHFVDLEQIKKIRQLCPGSTVNDVVLAIVSGALRRYLLAKRALPDDSLVAAVPIALRTSETAGDPSANQLVPRSVPLCTHIDDADERLKAIHEVMTSTKAYVNAVGAKTLLGVNNALPGAVLGMLARATFTIGQMRGRTAVANTLVTNVPGSLNPQYLCGAKVLKLTGGAPPMGTMGVAHAVGSYCGEMMFNVVACRDMLPDPEFYMQCIDQSIKEYIQLSRRRKPKKQPTSASGPDAKAAEGGKKTRQSPAKKRKVAQKSSKRKSNSGATVDTARGAATTAGNTTKANKSTKAGTGVRGPRKAPAPNLKGNTSRTVSRRKKPTASRSQT